MENALNTDIAQAGGWLTLAASVATWGLEQLSQMEFNDVLQIILAIGGIFFLYFKIKTQVFEYKIKKEIYEEKTSKKKK